MHRALVTGAGGFIGSHLCESLIRSNWSVVGVDNFDEFYEPRIKRSNLSAISKSGNFTLHEADIRDHDRMTALCRDSVDVIVHLAARAGVRPSIENPLLYQDVNVHGTNVMLEAARAGGVSRFIFASSSSVYGDSPKVPFSESDNVDSPISPYAATKKAGELICFTYHHLFKINITCLRFFTVYGARQRPDLAIHKFTRLIDQGAPIPFFGDGTMMRDHTYIDDIIAGVRAAIDRCTGFHVYNLGESQPVSLNDLVAAIEKALGKKATLNRLPHQPGDVQRTFADVSLARKELSYSPSTPIDVGLAKFIEWYRAQHG